MPTNKTPAALALRLLPERTLYSVGAEVYARGGRDERDVLATLYEIVVALLRRPEMASVGGVPYVDDRRMVVVEVDSQEERQIVLSALADVLWSRRLIPADIAAYYDAEISE